MLKRIVAMARSLTSLFRSSRSIKNVIWNMLGGAWAGVLIVLATPYYVNRLGLEGYGIVGLWLMMQVMIGLLDMGMGATLVKEFANVRQNPGDLSPKRDLLKTLESIYWVVSFLFALVLVLSAGWVSNYWLKSIAPPDASLGNAIRLMAITLGLQFPYVLYSNGLSGLQEHGKMNALQMAGNGLRYGGGAAILFWRADLVWFFAAQTLVAAAQTFATRRAVWKMISETGDQPPTFRLRVLQRLWRFSAGMALTAISAVLLANVDRIALSKLMSTAELGKYAVAFTATGLLQMGIQPFYRAFFPRYSELVSTGDSTRLRAEYYRSCRLMAAVIIPLSIIGWLFAPQLFHAWIGRTDTTIISVFRWLLVGITTSGLVWLPAAFQQAHGWTRLHVAMIAGALLLGTPVMIWAIKTYGTVGATAVWVLHGVSDITLGLWLMHKRLLIGDLLSWYRSVLLPPLLVSFPLVGLSFWLMPHDLNRWACLGWVGATGPVVLAVTVFFHLGEDRNRFLFFSIDAKGE